jgi:hypothetical protein
VVIAGDQQRGVSPVLVRHGYRWLAARPDDLHLLLGSHLRAKTVARPAAERRRGAPGARRQRPSPGLGRGGAGGQRRDGLVPGDLRAVDQGWPNDAGYPLRESLLWVEALGVTTVDRVGERLAPSAGAARGGGGARHRPPAALRQPGAPAQVERVPARMPPATRSSSDQER